MCLVDPKFLAAAFAFAGAFAAGCAAPMEPVDVTTPPTTPLTCGRDQPAAALPLQMIPGPPPGGPGLFLLQQIGGACEGLGPKQVLLQNISSAAVMIDAVGSSDEHFTVTAAGLPRALEPGATLAMLVGFQADAVREFAATLAVAGPTGCVEFPMRGQAVDAAEESVATFSPYVVDFGRVPAGTASAPQELTILLQPKPSSGGTKATGFGTTSELFEIVAEPTEADFSTACQRLKVGVRFLAPTMPGMVHEYIAWSVVTSLDGLEFDAAITADLVAFTE